MIVSDNLIHDCDNLGTNLAALGADVGGLFVPGATGLGLGVRSARSIPDIRGHTKKLRNHDLVDDIKRDMLNNQYEYDSARGIISGIEDANGIIHIQEGQHRINAALEIFEETGDAKYVNQLLDSARKEYGGRVYLGRGSAPRGSTKLPRRQDKAWWKLW